MDKYVPPYDITEEMLGLTSEITEDLGKLSNVNDLERLPRLRRVNRIKSIQSSLAIENNTLSLEQVTDVINGKRVLGPQDDILAVKNAFAAYNNACPCRGVVFAEPCICRNVYMLYIHALFCV